MCILKYNNNNYNKHLTYITVIFYLAIAVGNNVHFRLNVKTVY